MKTRDLAFVGLFAALTTVASVISIPLPFTPVPITLQVMVVLLTGAVLGPRLGALTQLVYVLLGAVGAPVYAGGAAGLGALFGKTGGYLFGFILAAWLVGLVSGTGFGGGRKPEGAGSGPREGVGGYGVYLRQLVAMAVGLVAIYALGMTQLAIVLHVSIGQAFVWGVAPFLALDAFKALAAAVLASALHARGLGLAWAGRKWQAG